MAAAAVVERNNTSPVKGTTTGHGLGLGSGSGAAGWLSGSTSSLGGSIDSVEREVGASMGRRYHIPAVEAAKASAAKPDDLFLRLNPSGSGDVDLDLSFDFVSQLENTRPVAVQTPIYEKSEGSATERTSPSPKGMSTAKRWGSRAKKQPPAALPMLKKKQLLAATDLTSQFSPISPLDHKRDYADEEPLTITRLGATKRAADSGIQSRMDANPPAQEVDRAALIRQQRNNALRKQQQQPQQSQRFSPEKKSFKGNASPKKRVALGENKAKNNMQIGHVEEVEDIFDDATYDYHKHLTKSTSLASTKTGGVQSSFATAHESNAGRSRKGRPMPADSMDSLNTFNTADSVEGAVEGNMLGLDLTGGAAMGGAGLSLNVPEDANNNSSPLSTQTSSPGTPFSPLFSDGSTTRGSEFTNGAPSDGATTPGTAFSTLFDERQLELKGPSSATMLRGPSAPVSAKPLVNEVIEEEKASLKRANTEPRSSFTASLPSDEYREGRSLHLDHSADGSSSDLGSSPIRGKQQMVLSTADSMTNDAKFLFRQPMLHGQDRAKGEEPSNALGLGLGIDMGQMGEDDNNNNSSTHHFMGDLSVERAMLSNDVALDLGLAMTKEDTMLASQSFTSSADGFAINITPAGYKSQAPELRIDVPAAMGEDQASKQDEQSKGRWSSKLWSMASKSPLSPFRPSSRAAGEDQERTPTMKSLTLVDRRNADNGPLSAPLPSQAVFNPSLPVPAQAWHSETQDGTASSTRASRIRYLTNDDGHVRVNLNDDKEATSTSETATPASVLTPKMEYIMSVKNHRHSWAYSSDAGGFSGTPSWLSEAGVEKKVDAKTRPTLLRNSTLSAVGGDDEDAAGENMLHPTLETIAEDGIRRRVRHRATNSVPSSPFMVPHSWTSPNPEAGSTETPEEKARARFHSSQEEQHQQQHATRRRRTKTLGSRMSIFGPASISITPYLTGLTGSRYRSRMVKATSLKPSVYSKADAQTQIRIFSDDRGPVEGLIAYSGRALENASPSRSLFFAGFLAMPWLWFIGGWCLENDGSVYIERDIFWDQDDEDLNRFEMERRQSIATKVLLASGRRMSRASTLPTHRSSVLHEVTMPSQENQHNNDSVIDIGQDVYTPERPYSFIARSSWMIERLDRPHHDDRRASSMLHGKERHSIQPVTLEELRNSVAMSNYQYQENGGMQQVDLGQHDNNDDQNVGIAYSTHGHSSVTAHPSYAQQADFAAAAAQTQSQSQWDEYDESKDKMQKAQIKKKGMLGGAFFQQVFAANTTMMAKLATASARVSDSSSMRSSLKNRRAMRHRESIFTQVQPQSQLLSALTNWSGLERFVLLNRIMAIVMSLAVFGAAGVAIAFVISDW